MACLIESEQGPRNYAFVKVCNKIIIIKNNYKIIIHIFLYVIYSHFSLWTVYWLLQGLLEKGALPLPTAYTPNNETALNLTAVNLGSYQGDVTRTYYDITNDIILRRPIPPIGDNDFDTPISSVAINLGSFPGDLSLQLPINIMIFMP